MTIWTFDDVSDEKLELLREHVEFRDDAWPYHKVILMLIDEIERLRGKEVVCNARGKYTSLPL